VKGSAIELPAVAVHALEMLVRSRSARSTARWPELVAVCTLDGDRVVHRVAFAAELRADPHLAPRRST
jgi:hypothetical protein